MEIGASWYIEKSLSPQSVTPTLWVPGSSPVSWWQLQCPVSSKASKASMVQGGISFIPPLHFSLHGASKRQHLDTSTWQLPFVPALALGDKRQGTSQMVRDQPPWGRAPLQNMAGDPFQTELAGGSIAYLQMYVGGGSSKMMSNYFFFLKYVPHRLYLWEPLLQDMNLLGCFWLN